MLLEKTYLPVINFIYDRIKRLDEKTRKAIIIICVAVEVLSTYIYQCDEFFGFIYYAMPNFMVGAVCFTGIIIAGIDRRIEEIKVKKWPVYLMMLCGAAVFISGIHHFITYSYMIMGLFMLLMMPAFLIVWGGRRDFDRLFGTIAGTITIFFIAFVIVNCILAPIGAPEFSTGGRYFGVAADPNGLAKIAVTACICSIYMVATKKGAWKIPFAVVFLTAVVFTVLTASRTNLMALILICIAALIFLIKSYVCGRGYSVRRIIAISCILVIAAAGAAIISGSSGEDGYVSIIKARLSQGVFEDGTVDINALSSGRIEIWEFCLSKTSVIGNDVSNGMQDDLIVIDNDHAHNTVIELLYRSGIIAGICFLIIELYCAVWTARAIFAGRRNSPAEMMASLLMIAFIMASIFDIVVLPFAKMTTFLFYFSLPVVFAKNECERQVLINEEQ